MADVKTAIKLVYTSACTSEVQGSCVNGDCSLPGTILLHSRVGTRFVLCCVGEIHVLQCPDWQCGQISTARFYFLFPCRSAEQLLLYLTDFRNAQCLATLGQVVLNPLEEPQPGQDGWEWKSQWAEEQKQQHFVLVVVCFL